MDMHEELLKRGFSLLHSATRTYGNGKMTGSIVFEKKGKIIDDEDAKDAVQIFCPFIKTDDDKKPNHNYQSVRLRNVEELDQYLYY